MASIPSSSVQFPNTLSLPSPPKPHKSKPPLTFTTRSSDPGSPPAEPGPESTGADFEDRLAKIRLKYRSGTGKKAEERKARKSKKGSSAAAASSVYLPPVALKEAEAGGLRVEFGFSPYSERVNGWVAMVGLSALVSVELASGKGVINYHTPGTVLIQLYFVAAVAALAIKYQKEKLSVWPCDEIQD